MIVQGAQVEHGEFGIGNVLSVLGNVATVEFFGETFDVDVGELLVRDSQKPAGLPASSQATSDFSFRQSFEAVNLGVVPTNPDQLVALTIGGKDISSEIRGILKDAPTQGACRIYMGYYGSGKSHHLRLVKAIALREGWVTASLELDPKAADPAKPSTVYRELMAGLEFPMRADGTRCGDFFDLVKEVRDNWSKIKGLKYFSRSPWFSLAIEALQYLTHRRDDAEYVSAVSWLAGQVKQISAIRSIGWRAGRKSIPSMPQTKDTGVVYSYHLVVLNEVLKALGYRGLALIVDEAEHVRTYSALRYIRANNFFDVLARCAHKPRPNFRDPRCDYNVSGFPAFWKEGPHFALFVGLTEGEDTQDLKRKAGEMSVLIHDPREVVRLQPPSPADYEHWVAIFLAESAGRLGPKMNLLADGQLRARIAKLLRENFEQLPDTEKLLRNWTKMAGFPAAVLMSQPSCVEPDELVAIVGEAAQQIAGDILPWE
ncbi:hypothetical protein J2R96_005881 [Bradyrhizobium elkanii]|nr:hypothetical protein [Bradyrhizobium elkanii]